MQRKTKQEKKKHRTTESQIEVERQKSDIKL